MPVIQGGQLYSGITTGYVFKFAGTPVSGVSGTMLNQATVGDVLADTVAGKLYICTVSSGASITWALVGSQV